MEVNLKDLSELGISNLREWQNYGHHRIYFNFFNSNLSKKKRSVEFFYDVVKDSFFSSHLTVSDLDDVFSDNEVEIIKKYFRDNYQQVLSKVEVIEENKEVIETANSTIIDEKTEYLNSLERLSIYTISNELNPTKTKWLQELGFAQIYYTTDTNDNDRYNDDVITEYETNCFLKNVEGLRKAFPFNPKLASEIEIEKETKRTTSNDRKNNLSELRKEIIEKKSIVTKYYDDNKDYYNSLMKNLTENGLKIFEGKITFNGYPNEIIYILKNEIILCETSPDPYNGNTAYYYVTEKEKISNQNFIENLISTSLEKKQEAEKEISILKNEIESNTLEFRKIDFLAGSSSQFIIKFDDMGNYYSFFNVYDLSQKFLGVAIFNNENDFFEIRDVSEFIKNSGIKVKEIRDVSEFIKNSGIKVKKDKIALQFSDKKDMQKIIDFSENYYKLKKSLEKWSLI